MREGPGIQPCGSQGTPTSFSSASSSDGDLDFGSPRSSHGQRLGKGELVQPQAVVLWEGAQGPCPPLSLPQCQKSWDTNAEADLGLVPAE